MKKLVLILAFAIGSIYLSQAQSSEKLGGFGVRGGASLFGFGGKDVSDNDYTNRIGFHVGGYAAVYMTDLLAIEPGVYYSVKGTQNDNIVASRAVLNYVDVPVLIRFYPVSGVNIFAGPQISFLSKSKFEGDIFGNTVSYNADAIKETDFALVLGAGFNLSTGINVQASYDYGITPIFKGSDADVFNRGFKVSVGYTF